MLVQITGQDFGYDLQAWHDHLKESREGGYTYGRNIVLPRIMQEALLSPEWQEAVESLTTALHLTPPTLQVSGSSSSPARPVEERRFGADLRARGWRPSVGPVARSEDLATTRPLVARTRSKTDSSADKTPTPDRGIGWRSIAKFRRGRHHRSPGLKLS